MHYFYKSLLLVNSTYPNLLLSNFPAIRQTDNLVIDVSDCIKLKIKDLFFQLTMSPQTNRGFLLCSKYQNIRKVFTHSTIHEVFPGWRVTTLASQPSSFRVFHTH